MKTRHRPAADPVDETADEAADEAAGETGADDVLPEEASAAPAARRRFPTMWVALAVVVGLLLGFVAGLLTPALRAPGDTSAEAGFARDMIAHHGQAVEMSMIAYYKATDPDVRGLAYDVVTNQQGQVGIMTRWLQEWRLSPTGSRARMAWMPEGTAALQDGLMPGMATQAQMDQLREATGEKLDVLYVQLMLRHHLGGIHMVDGVLDRSDRPEVVELATTMKAGQQLEVNIFRTLLEKLHAQPL
jgi:uncharacterized protein (DUF305 family)